jgi:hypothetical protein
MNPIDIANAIDRIIADHPDFADLDDDRIESLCNSLADAIIANPSPLIDALR